MNTTDDKTYVTYNTPHTAPTVGQPVKSQLAVTYDAWQTAAWQQDTGILKIQELENRLRDLEEKCQFQEEFIKKVNSLYELLVNDD